MLNWIKNIGFILILTTVMQSCNLNTDCSVNITDFRMVKVKFCVRTKNLLKNTEKDTSINNVLIRGLGATDSIYKPQTGWVEKATLPLSQLHDSCRYVFVFDSTYTDTLLFIYSHEMQIVGDYCFASTFTLKNVQRIYNKADTLNNIDTIVTFTNRVNPDVDFNIKFYVKHIAIADTTKKTQ